MNQLVLQYFNAHPEDKDAVTKAFHAYHVTHFRAHPQAHHFLDHKRTASCQWCGRTRELVRWDDEPATCSKRPELPDIADILTAEWMKAEEVYQRSKKQVPRIVEKMGMSGATLATLHHTHGFDPETVSSIVDVPQAVMEAYNAAMDQERDKSRHAIVRTILVCQ